MPPAYGDMLSAFPELMTEYEVFKMKPHTGAGYGKRHDRRTVTGYWSWRKHTKMGIEGDLRTANDQATFWAKDDFLTGKKVVGQGDYIEVDGTVFLVVEDDSFSREGGFTRCTMQRVAGPDGRQVVNQNVDKAVLGDY
jgi:hypothetical protein